MGYFFAREDKIMIAYITMPVMGRDLYDGYLVKEIEVLCEMNTNGDWVPIPHMKLPDYDKKMQEIQLECDKKNTEIGATWMLRKA